MFITVNQNFKPNTTPLERAGKHAISRQSMSYSAGKSRESRRESCDGQPLRSDCLAYLAPVSPATYSNPKWNFLKLPNLVKCRQDMTEKIRLINREKILTELKTNTARFQTRTSSPGLAIASSDLGRRVK